MVVLAYVVFPFNDRKDSSTTKILHQFNDRKNISSLYTGGWEPKKLIFFLLRLIFQLKEKTISLCLCCY